MHWLRNAGRDDRSADHCCGSLPVELSRHHTTGQTAATAHGRLQTSVCREKFVSCCLRQCAHPGSAQCQYRLRFPERSARPCAEVCCSCRTLVVRCSLWHHAAERLLRSRGADLLWARAQRRRSAQPRSRYCEQSSVAVSECSATAKPARVCSILGGSLRGCSHRPKAAVMTVVSSGKAIFQRFMFICDPAGLRGITDDWSFESGKSNCFPSVAHRMRAACQRSDGF